MRYRRAKVDGGTFFFTLVTHERRALFGVPDNLALLRQALRTVRQRHPFRIDAIVVLPDHLHCIWTLPEGDHDFPKRWRLIKSQFSRGCKPKYKPLPSRARVRKQEQAIWQRRFWEHQIRDEADFVGHVEYIHYNPVKHGLATSPREWRYSSFHRFVREGLYPAAWGAGKSIEFGHMIGHE